MARVYQAQRDKSWHVSSEEYTGAGTVQEMSLLAMCCVRRWRDQACALIDAGADPDNDAGVPYSPMSAAAAEGDTSMMEMLRFKGASTDCEGCTPLMAASVNGMLDAAKWLVDHGARVTTTALAPDLSGQITPASAIILAAVRGHVAVKRFLHALGAPFAAAAGGQVHTALHEAAREGYADCARFILACGFTIDTRRSDGTTALHWASRCGHRAVIELLLRSGADIEAADNDGFTPLMHAMVVNKAETVNVLVGKGAFFLDGRATNKGATDGSIEALTALLSCPQWLSMSRSQRLRAEALLLHYVKDNATLNAIRALVVDMSALIEMQTATGDNPLHSVAHHGKGVPVICALIKEGVNPAARNRTGRTPADVAREAGHTLQATLLDRAADDKRKRDLQQRRAA